MSKKSNPVAIGAFVVGAIALGLVGLMVFGSGRFFRETYTYVLYFESDVSGLAGFEDYYPSQISGGMQKRAGLARAMALDPDVLFFDEPSAGLDPISSRLLDDLILELQASLGATIVVVTHELASIFAIATNSVFLDVETRTMTDLGSPKELLDSGSASVRRFLSRGGSEQ